MTRSLKDEPWWVDKAIARVEQFLLSSPRSRVFEWGSGGSTVWLAKRCELLLSVEHTKAWADTTQSHVVGYTHALLLEILLGPDYPRAITGYPSRSFDLICVDGRMRNECVQEAIPQLRHGGMLLLDNSERDRYAPSFELLKNWHREDYSNRETRAIGGGWQTSLFCDDPALQETPGHVE